MRAVVRTQTIRSDSHQDLIERLAFVSELLINSGGRIIAIFPSPTWGIPDEWAATIFSAFEVDR
jgi:hypothetical protein